MSSSSRSGREFYDFAMEQQTEGLLARRLGRDWREAVHNRRQRQLEQDAAREEERELAIQIVRERRARAREPRLPTTVHQRIGNAVVSYNRSNQDPAGDLLSSVRPELGQDHPSNAMSLHPNWYADNQPFFGVNADRNAWNVEDSAIESDTETVRAPSSVVSDTESEAESVEIYESGNRPQRPEDDGAIWAEMQAQTETTTSSEEAIESEDEWETESEGESDTESVEMFVSGNLPQRPEDDAAMYAEIEAMYADPHRNNPDFVQQMLAEAEADNDGAQETDDNTTDNGQDDNDEDGGMGRSRWTERTEWFRAPAGSRATQVFVASVVLKVVIVAAIMRQRR
jgi:hypothetical protein